MKKNQKLQNSLNIPTKIYDQNSLLEKFPYLKKVYDSQKNGFKYHVKVFEIDYKAYDIMQDNRD